jgi:hypothetical protein
MVHNLRAYPTYLQEYALGQEGEFEWGLQTVEGVVEKLDLRGKKRQRVWKWIERKQICVYGRVQWCRCESYSDLTAKMQTRKISLLPRRQIVLEARGWRHYVTSQQPRPNCACPDASLQPYDRRFYVSAN